MAWKFEAEARFRTSSGPAVVSLVERGAEAQYDDPLVAGPTRRGFSFVDELRIVVARLDRGELEVAHDALLELTRRYPGEALGHLWLGTVHFRRDELAEARAAFRRALELAGAVARSRRARSGTWRPWTPGWPRCRRGSPPTCRTRWRAASG